MGVAKFWFRFSSKRVVKNLIGLQFMFFKASDRINSDNLSREGCMKSMQ
jgi:hypothetical protein